MQPLLLLTALFGCSPEPCKQNNIPEDYQDLFESTKDNKPLSHVVYQESGITLDPYNHKDNEIDVFIDEESIPADVDIDVAVEAIKNSFWTFEKESNEALKFNFIDDEGIDRNTFDPSSTADRINTVYFEPDWTNYHSNSSVLANTEVAADYYTGSIQEFNIAINAEDYIWKNNDYSETGGNTSDETKRHDLQNIMTHEVGHAVGLAHYSCSEDETHTMCEKADEGETHKRYLSELDRTALMFLYGECSAY